MAQLQLYMDSNRLKFNLTKTALITFSPTAGGAVTSITTPTGIISSSTTLKALGVTFDSGLT